MPEGCFNLMVQMMGDAFPSGNYMPTNLYYVKKSIENLGLGCIKIDCYPKGFMLYYKDDKYERSCKFCGHERFK